MEATVTPVFEPRLVAVDGTGTLQHSDGTISEYTKGVIEKVQSWGIPVVLVTGKRFEKAVATLESAGMRQYVIAENGARAVKIENGEALYESWLDGAEAAVPIRRIQNRMPGQCFFVQLTKEGALIEAVHPWMQNEQQRQQATSMYGPGVPDLLGELELPEVMCAKSYATVPNSSDFGATMAEIKAAAGEGWDVRQVMTLLTGGSHNTCEVQSAKVNKVDGLRGLCKALKIPMENVWAFGDDCNDASMLSEAGWGIRMSNHKPGLKGVGNDVTRCSNDEDGFAKYLEEHLLQTAENSLATSCLASAKKP